MVLGITLQLTFFRPLPKRPPPPPDDDCCWSRFAPAEGFICHSSRCLLLPFGDAAAAALASDSGIVSSSNDCLRRKPFSLSPAPPPLAPLLPLLAFFLLSSAIRFSLSVR